MAEKKEAASAPAQAGVSKVSWNDTQMATSYANVVNAVSTREEFALFFGTNQTWNLTKEREVKVQLTNRIILNPHAAKRLNMLLSSILTEYESRYGVLDTGVASGTSDDKV